MGGDGTGYGSISSHSRARVIAVPQGMMGSAVSFQPIPAEPIMLYRPGMKTCIIGAGAIGGIIGARIAASGGTVSALARGDTLKALRANGWRLKQGDQLIAAPVAAASE